MTLFIRRILRKLGRVGLVAILTLLSTVSANLMNFGLIDLLGLDNSLVDEIISVTVITCTITPALSWYLVGLLFHIDKLEIEMTKLASTDTLTHTFNRGFFYQESERFLSRHYAAHKSDQDLQPAVIIIDLDNLKTINDLFGHSGGDNVLTALGMILNKVVQKPNIVGRIGGDEFAILVKETNLHELQTIMTELFERIRDYAVNMDGQPYYFTISAGISFNCRDDVSLDSALKRADVALYHIKRAERNDYAIYEEIARD
ncbi:GGDEF domain-containing protein [Marinomonas sp. C2222]|uniref:diguanylate cyclase n=1 Tax=Marinomonas sargassi TaxID=2984494 RepID=A0ABT2YUJ8_9GAMM|nr:GGDEF domain-containing protein [Marinomonas sargassi]MCV2403568.1 GGDEF domain-containing protein [Marinomonas sargassi]